jgi:hypothetical protein
MRWVFHGDPLPDRRRDAVEIRDGFRKVSQLYQQKILRSPWESSNPRFCDLEALEIQKPRHYVSLRLPDGFADRVREELAAALADEERRVRLVHEHLTKRINELDVAENNLLDLVEAGGAVAAKVRDRLMAIGEERGRVKSELAEQGPLLEAGAAVIEAALGPAGRPAGAIPPNE